MRYQHEHPGLGHALDSPVASRAGFSPWQVNELLQAGVGTVYTAAVVHVRQGGQTVYEQAAGYIHPEVVPFPATSETQFDLASLTKLFVATAFLLQVASGHVTLETPVHTILPEFRGLRPIQPYEDPLQPGRWVTVSEEKGPVNADEVTFRHVLTHTSGLPAWRPLYMAPPRHRRMRVLHTAFAYPPGRRVVYSDLGFMILGWALEAIMGASLSSVLDTLVCKPLGLQSVRFRTAGNYRGITHIAATERCAWRQRRVWGEVHDENAWALGGVAGHAGLFATARDVAAFGQAWLDALRGRGPFATLGSLAQEAVRLHAEDHHVRRGLGWALWSPAPESPSRPFGPRAFGHTGFTGTSLYVDPERNLVVAALTNRVYYGRMSQPIARWRYQLHHILSQHSLPET